MQQWHMRWLDVGGCPWWRCANVTSHPIRLHAPGAQRGAAVWPCVPPASHTPRACRRPAHRTRQTTLSPVKRATPRPAPRISETEISVPSPASVLLPAAPWAPPSYPFFSVSSLPIPHHRFPTAIEERAGLNRALKSPHRAPSSLRLPHPDLD